MLLFYLAIHFRTGCWYQGCQRTTLFPHRCFVISATSYRSKNKRIALKTSGVYLYTMRVPKILMEYLDSNDEEIDGLHLAQQLILLPYSTNSESGVKSGGSRPAKRPNINRFVEEGALDCITTILQKFLFIQTNSFEDAFVCVGVYSYVSLKH